MLQTLCIGLQEQDFLISRPQVTDAEKFDKLFQTERNKKNNSDSSKLLLWLNTDKYVQYIIVHQLAPSFLQSEQNNALNTLRKDSFKHFSGHAATLTSCLFILTL